MRDEHSAENRDNTEQSRLAETLTEALTFADSQAISYSERAAFYEVEYGEEVDQPFLQSLVTDQVHSILEIPCGAGRNLEWLAETGRSVVCADIEPMMIQRIEERTRELSATDRVDAAVADIRAPDLDRTFDLILIPREAFQLLTDYDDALQALNALGEHLSTGGTLMIDLCTFSPDVHGESSIYPDYFDPEMQDDKLLLEWSRNLSLGKTLARSRIQHREGSNIKVEYFYTIAEEGLSVKRWNSEIGLKAYDYESFSALLSETNLEIRKSYRNYCCKPYVPGSARIITLIGHSDPIGEEDAKIYHQ